MGARFAKIAAVVVLGLVVALYVGVKTLGPKLIRERLTTLVQKNCVSCRLEIGGIGISVWPSVVRFRDVRFSGGDPRVTAVGGAAKIVAVPVALGRMLAGETYLRRIEVLGATVAVVEGDLKSPRTEAFEGGGPAPRHQFVVEGIRVLDSDFSYTRVYADRAAALHVWNVQIFVDEFGSTEDLKEKVGRAVATGRVEHSGEFRLAVDMPFFERSLSVDVDLRIDNQNLADISPFFERSGDLKIKGSLYRGHGYMNLRGKRLEGWVLAQYDSFGVTALESKRQGAFSAAFSNLITSVRLKPSVIGRAPAEQKSGVALRAEDDETPLQLILRGLRDGALKVAM